jgi:hypothetical protein
VDVSITHPTARSYVASAAQGPLRRAAAVVVQKHLKYDAIAAALQHTQFVAFVLESYGGWSSEALTFLKLLVKNANLADPAYTSDDLYWELRTTVSVALQRWNARACGAVLFRSTVD